MRQRWPAFLHSAVLACVLTAVARGGAPSTEPPPLEVYPGQSIQAALNKAGADPLRKRVRVHAGAYRPAARGQALIYFNFKHDGICLEAEGEVTLTAANPELANPAAPSFPAIVNHVIYFGDGVSRKTTVRGFKITGANNFVTDQAGDQPMEPHFDQLRNTEGFYGRLFFYTDGGGIKIFGRSYPTLQNLEVVDNYSSPCAGGVSIEHRGFTNNSVLIENCIFRNNRAMVTGAAVDLLPRSAAEIRNCLFVGNLSNRGDRYTPVEGNIAWPEIPRLVESTVRYQPEHGSGALTVFPESTVLVDGCTFTGNFNGADDKGRASVYRNSIFWMNTAPGPVRPGRRFELDVANGAGVSNCFVRGEINGLRNNLGSKVNALDCPDPEFDSDYSPRSPAFARAGYRRR